MLVRQRCPSRSRSRTTSHRFAFVSALALRASPRLPGARPVFGPGAWFGGFSFPPSHVEVIRSLKFLGEPHCEHAPLSDPDPVTCPRFSACHCCLPRCGWCRLPDHIAGFRSSHHAACSLAVYASPGESPLRPQHSLPAGHHPLLDRFRTCRVLYEGFRRCALTYVIVLPLSEAFLTLPQRQLRLAR